MHTKPTQKRYPGEFYTGDRVILNGEPGEIISANSSSLLARTYLVKFDSGNPMSEYVPEHFLHLIVPEGGDLCAC